MNGALHEDRFHVVAYSLLMKKVAVRNHGAQHILEPVLFQTTLFYLHTSKRNKNNIFWKYRYNENVHGNVQLINTRLFYLQMP